MSYVLLLPWQAKLLNESFFGGMEIKFNFSMKMVGSLRCFFNAESIILTLKLFIISVGLQKFLTIRFITVRLNKVLNFWGAVIIQCHSGRNFTWESFCRCSESVDWVFDSIQQSLFPSFVPSPPEDVDDKADHEYGVNDEPESEKVGPVGGSDHLGYQVLVMAELANWRTGVQLSVTKTGQTLIIIGSGTCVTSVVTV